MSVYSRVLSVVALVAVAAGFPAVARSQATLPYELGVDGTVIRRFETFEGRGIKSTSDFTSVSLPVNAIRVGLFVTRQIELEPSLSYMRVSTGGDSFSQIDLSIAAPLYFTPDRTKSQFFVRPVVGLLKVTGNDGAQVNVGAGLGVKIPIDRRIATRLEAEYRHGNQAGAESSYNQIGLILGFSVYTR
jgi:hypothetical protein